MVFVFEVEAVMPPRTDEELEAVHQRWTTMLTILPYHWRWITATQPIDLGPLRAQVANERTIVQTAQHYAARIPEERSKHPDVRSWLVRLPSVIRRTVLERLDQAPATEDLWEFSARLLQSITWRGRWLDEYDSWMHAIERMGKRVYRHFLFLWHDPPPDTPARSYAERIAEQLSTTLGTRVYLVDQASPVTAFRRVSYRERVGWRNDHCYLEPLANPAPYIQTLALRAPLRGWWSPAVWHHLCWTIHDIDMWIAVDMIPVPRPTLVYQIEHMLSTYRTATRPAERMYLEAAQRAVARVDREAGYDVRVAVALAAPSLDRLRTAMDTVHSELAGKAETVVALPGKQRALVEVFDPVPRPSLPDIPAHRMLAGDVASLLNPYVRSWPYRTGIIWMMSQAGPICFDPMADGAAAHTVIIGKTGSGKTFAVNTIAMRLASRGARIVLFEPQGHARRLAAAARAGGAYYAISAHESYNVLDVLVGRGPNGEPPSLAEQSAAVIGLLGVVLGSYTLTPTGYRFHPREWTSLERAVLERAIQRVYGSWQDMLDEIPDDQMPTLHDLVAVMRNLDIPTALESGRVQAEVREQADRLATEITMRILEGPNEPLFGRRTSMQWSFDGDVICYDLSSAPEGPVRVLAYTLGIGALNRTLRRQRNQRPTFAIIDEFGAMTMASPSVASFAAEIAKTGRAFRLGVIAMDQDAQTFLDATTDPGGHRRSIWNNATIRMIFRQDYTNADLVVAAIDGLVEHDRDNIAQLQRGQCLLVWDGAPSGRQEFAWGTVTPTALELQSFAGT